MELTLLERLDNARNKIESAYEKDDHIEISKYFKRFKPLYEECIQQGFESKEYHYAEYLKYYMMHYFYNILDTLGDSYEIYEQSQTEKWKAGLRANKYTGKYIDDTCSQKYA